MNASVAVEMAQKASKPTVLLLITGCFFYAFMAVAAGVFEAFSPIQDSTTLTLDGLFVLGDLILRIVTAIFYFTWLSKSIQAVTALSSRSFPVSPGLAIGYYFIPLLCIFKPFLNMWQLLDWSTPTTEHVPAMTKLAFASWWICWIFGDIFLFYGERTYDSNGSAIGAILDVIAVSALLKIVTSLPNIQLRRLSEVQGKNVPPVSMPAAT